MKAETITYMNILIINFCAFENHFCDDSVKHTRQ